MSATVEAALAWAARGFFVFPLLPGSKLPAVKDWPERASKDPDVIRAMWGDRDFNIGVHAQDHIIIDVDTKGGKNGPSAFLETGYDADTLTVRTPTGGTHVYYTGPNVSNSASKLGDGLDVRSYHGYVIAPGSRVADGEYQVEHDAPIKEAPLDLIEKCGAPRGDKTLQAPQDTDQGEAVLRAVRWLQEAPVAVEGQGGDALTFQTAAKLKDLGLTYQNALSVIAEHWNTRCEPPWSADELKTKVENAYAYGTRTPGVDSLSNTFSGVSIPDATGAVNRVWFDHGADFSGGIRWLYHNLLPATGVAILTAPSQSGKTFLALDLMHSLAVGRPFFETDPEEKGGSIILTAEGASSIRYRMAALTSPSRLPITASPLEQLGEKGALAALEADLRAKIYAMFLEFQVQVRLVILDTLSASGLMTDQNSNAEAAKALSALGKMAEKLGLLMIVIHHPPKNGTGVGGAGALANRADYVLEISLANDQIREVELTKARDCVPRKIGSFTLLTVKIGEDDRTRDITSCTISTGPVLKRSERKPDHADRILAALSSAVMATSHEAGITETEWFDMVSAMEIGNVGKPRVLRTVIDWAIKGGMVTTSTVDGTIYYKHVGADFD